MSLSVALMAHPSRKPFVDELLGQLDREPTVVWDRRNDRWDTGRRSMLAHDPAADWHLVIQDDMVPCRDLIAGIERACDAADSLDHRGPLGFYVGRLKPEDVQRTVGETVAAAHRAGASWISHEGPWWGPAIALRTSHIPDVVAFGDRRVDIENYDKKISRFYAAQRINCWYSVPSLVDHRAVDENPSLVPGRTGNRQAHLFIGAEKSALDITWTPPWEGDSMATHRNRKTGRTLRVPQTGRLAEAIDEHPDWERIAPAGYSTSGSQRIVVTMGDSGPQETPTVQQPEQTTGTEAAREGGQDVSPEPAEPVADQPDADDQSADDLEALSRNDLVAAARAEGVPAKGKSVEIIAAIRAAREDGQEAA